MCVCIGYQLNINKIIIHTLLHHKKKECVLFFLLHTHTKKKMDPRYDVNNTIDLISHVFIHAKKLEYKLNIILVIISLNTPFKKRFVCECHYFDTDPNYNTFHFNNINDLINQFYSNKILNIIGLITQKLFDYDCYILFNALIYYKHQLYLLDINYTDFDYYNNKNNNIGIIIKNLIKTSNNHLSIIKLNDVNIYGHQNINSLLNVINNPYHKIKQLAINKSNILNKIIKYTKYIPMIDFSHNNFSNKMINNLSKCLKHHKANIYSLDLACCNVSIKQFQKLSYCLKYPDNNLTYLCLSHNKLNLELIYSLSLILQSKNTRIITLILSFCDLDYNCILKLTNGLIHKNNKLRTLVLDWNNLEFDSIQLLTQKILIHHYCKLYHLDLKWNSFGLDGYEEIERCLETGIPKLKTFLISNHTTQQTIIKNNVLKLLQINNTRQNILVLCSPLKYKKLSAFRKLPNELIRQLYSFLIF